MEVHVLAHLWLIFKSLCSFDLLLFLYSFRQLSLCSLDSFGANFLELLVELTHAVERAHYVRNELRVLVQSLGALLSLMQLSLELPLLRAQNAVLKTKEASFVDFTAVALRIARVSRSVFHVDVLVARFL